MNQDTIQKIDSLLEGQHGSITQESFQELQKILRSDSAALDYYCQQADINSRLTWELSDPKNQHAPVCAPHKNLPRKVTKPSLISSPFLWGAVAACLAFFLGFTLYQGTNKPATQVVITSPTSNKPTPTVASQGASLARLTNSKNAHWGTPPHQNGSWLKPGVLHLLSGSAEISFDSGARVLLQGPAKLKLITARHASLSLGKATTFIPSQAVGFKLDTPSTSFSDQNSTFAVAVDADGSTEVHVIQGLVEATPRSNPTLARVLNEHSALRLNKANILAENQIKYDTRSFDQELPILSSLSKSYYLHWSLDGKKGGRLPETGSHTKAKFPATILARPGTSQLASADFTNGKFGKALQLNGRGAFLSSGFPGISGSAARTVSFWVRIAPDTPAHQAYSMIAWGTPRSVSGQKWQVAWNTRYEQQGTKGAIRTEFGGGYVIGSTDLRDGRWHHVAIVFLGGESADVSTHIRHYIDGRLETITAVKPKRINTELTSDQSRPTYIGRRLEDNIPNSSFKGSLDEIYIFSAALTPDQINKLYLKNQPPSKTFSASGNQ